MRHTFTSLPRVPDPRAQYLEAVAHDHPDAVVVADDLLYYTADTLEWIPSSNPVNARAWPGVGLNWFGPTIFVGAGAGMLGRIALLWSRLFAEGPARIVLTLAAYEGDATAERAASSPNEDRFLRVAFDRDAVVETFAALSALAASVAQDEERWLLHLGL